MMKPLQMIIEDLKKHKAFLNKEYNVKDIGIFGSHVHGEESDESDIDILVTSDEPIGWEFLDLKDYLEEILGKKVDLVTIKALRPHMKDNILEEVVYV